MSVEPVTGQHGCLHQIALQRCSCDINEKASPCVHAPGAFNLLAFDERARPPLQPHSTQGFPWKCQASRCCWGGTFSTKARSMRPLLLHHNKRSWRDTICQKRVCCVSAPRPFSRVFTKLAAAEASPLGKRGTAHPNCCQTLCLLATQAKVEIAGVHAKPFLVMMTHKNLRKTAREWAAAKKVATANRPGDVGGRSVAPKRARRHHRHQRRHLDRKSKPQVGS